jgi:zona occludens toxin (predicted ATPase)
MATHNKTTDWAHSIWDQMQFRMLFVMVFTWFLFAAVLKSLTLQRGSSTESCWQEARRAAYSLTPYAFMRI